MKKGGEPEKNLFHIASFVEPKPSVRGGMLKKNIDYVLKNTLAICIELGSAVVLYTP